MLTRINVYDAQRCVGSCEIDHSSKKSIVSNKQTIILPTDPEKPPSHLDRKTLLMRQTERLLASCHSQQCPHARSKEPFHLHLLGHLTRTADISLAPFIPRLQETADLTQTPIDLRMITSATFPIKAFEDGKSIEPQNIPTSVKEYLDAEKMLLFLSSNFLLIACYGECGEGDATVNSAHLHTCLRIIAITKIFFEGNPLPTNKEVNITHAHHRVLSKL